MGNTDGETKNSQPKNEDLIQNFHLQFNMYFGLTTIVLLSPYAINHAIQNRLMMALGTFVIVLVAGTNALFIFKRNVQVIPFLYFYLIILTTLVAGVFLQGESIIYWYYPFVFVVLSSVTHRQSRIMLIISAALLIPTVFYITAQETATRFAVTYIMVCLLGSLMIGLLDKAQQQQAALAMTDPLTGALNRRSMLTHLEDAAESFGRGLGSASLLMIDIDHFKRINDTLGHKAGDDALKAVTDSLLARKRQLDELFRTGGEEFIMLARGLDMEGSIWRARSFLQTTFVRQ